MSIWEYEGGQISEDYILIVGPGAGQKLSLHSDSIRSWISAGGRLLNIGLDESDARSLLPDVTMKKAEYICAFFEPAGMNSLLTGIGPADVTIREPRELSLISGGAKPVGDGILGMVKDTNLIFCQLVPWQFDYKKYYNLKRSFLRTSFMVTRILGNMGANSITPLVSRFSTPFGSDNKNEALHGFYLDIPEEMDDPYRYFRW